MACRFDSGSGHHQQDHFVRIRIAASALVMRAFCFSLQVGESDSRHCIHHAALAIAEGLPF
jgi:hypothetical protein